MVVRTRVYCDDMILHVVAFTWNDDFPDGHLETVERELNALRAHLGGTISDYRFGPDLGLSDGTADFGIVATFATEADWRVYDEDELHNRIRAEVFRPYVKQRSVFQIQA